MSLRGGVHSTPDSGATAREPDVDGGERSERGRSSLHVGVDVGGTFTKAVAVDLVTREIVASAVVPTTHTATGGVAAGVVDAVAKLAAEVGAERIELVTHSTTQAVNALLEGDAGEVGVIGMGRRPDLKRVGKRTRLHDVELSPASTYGSATSSSTSPTGCRPTRYAAPCRASPRPASPRCASPRRSPPTTTATRTPSPRWAATPACRCARRRS
ncbi:MAG: hydantoinase/oxoprolinase N-terminal domain-containing protein [Ilumatobacteraceae bacterium]